MQSKTGNETVWFLSKILLASTELPIANRNFLRHHTPSARTTRASSSTFSSLAFLRVEPCKQPYQQWGELLNFVAVGQTEFRQDLIRSIGEIDQDLAPVRRIMPSFDQAVLDEPVD